MNTETISMLPFRRTNFVWNHNYCVTHIAKGGTLGSTTRVNTERGTLKVLEQIGSFLRQRGSVIQIYHTELILFGSLTIGADFYTETGLWRKTSDETATEDTTGNVERFQSGTIVAVIPEE